MLGGVGGLEIVIILVIGIILFGVVKMPQIARLLGSGFGGYNKLKRGFNFSSLMDRMAGGDDDTGDGERRQENPGQGRQQQPPYQEGWQAPQGWQQPPYQQGGPNQGRQDPPPRGEGGTPDDRPDTGHPDARV